MRNLLLITLFLFFWFSYAQEITMFDESLSYKFHQDEERISCKDLGELMLKNLKLLRIIVLNLKIE